ncbi:MAG: decaprenyl-phosphate phosphoribosyltransferase [Kiritimatiellae bacterium]|nr:decaprenyl-phosphate phosphoribosyltransferase [Kiritimatiellia bacterium]
MNRLRSTIRLLRPEQWTKNAAVFAGAIFAQRLKDPSSVLISLAAFAAFCLASSAAYVVNDLLDREADRRHPVKSRRPLAAGEITVGEAVVAGLMTASGALGIAAGVGARLLISVLGYWALQAGYNALFRRWPVLDVLSLSAGFVLRAFAGAWVLAVEVSPWMLVCAFHLALFLALAKRRHEAASLEEGAREHRASLAGCPLPVLDQWVGVAAATTIVSYSLYTLSEQTVRKFGDHRLIWTLPFVVAGVFRYLWLMQRGDATGRPERALWADRPLLATVAAWTAVAAWLVHR